MPSHDKKGKKIKDRVMRWRRAVAVRAVETVVMMVFNWMGGIQMHAG